MSSNSGNKRFVPHELKLDAMFRVHNGETKASVARALGVPESTLRGWCKNHVLVRRLPRKPDNRPRAECNAAKHEEPIDLTKDGCAIISPDMLVYTPIKQECTNEYPARKYVNLAEINPRQQCWFWRWYKSVNSNEDRQRTSRNNVKVILDDALLNKFEFADSSASRREAIEHGEQLLKWLDAQGNNPSFSAVQVAQLRKLVENIKRGANSLNKTKIRRK